MADLNDLFTGTPPTYGVNVVGGGRSPFYGPAKDFGSYLMSLLGQPLPSYGGKIDPGMSPTLSALGQMMQSYSQSPLPGVMGQSQGVLGRFMNPSFANPMSRMQFGFPQYFGNQPGGGFQGGMGGQPTNPFMGGQNPFGGSGGVVPQGPPPGPSPWGPGLSGDPTGGLSVSPMSPPPQMGSINGGGFMAPGGNMTNAAMPISNKQVAVDGSTAQGGMTAGIANEVPFSMAGRTPMPSPPPLRPGQMTRQQWIDAGMKPGEKKAAPTNPKNIKLPSLKKRRPPQGNY